MVDFDLPPETLEIIHKFHDSDIVFFVEGLDDLDYWDYILKYLKIKNYYIEEVGGKDKLQKINEYLIKNKTRVITLNDCDYSKLFGQQIKNEQVIYTYGYSIENSIYCPKTIAKIIKKFSLTHNDYTSEVKKWYTNFCSDCKEILIFDIANEKFRKNKRIMGDSCNNFLSSKRSPNLSKTKISKHITEINPFFNEKEITDCKKIIKDDSRDLRFIIRGKFFTNGIVNLIKNIVKKEGRNPSTIPNDTLFVLCISDGCIVCNEMLKCVCFSSIIKNIKNAVKTLNT